MITRCSTSLSSNSRIASPIESPSAVFGPAMRTAVLGASGLVGRKMLTLLEDCRWLSGDPVLLTSARSAGIRAADAEPAGTVAVRFGAI